MIIEPPEIDNRKFSDLLQTLKGLRPHYTPEWVDSNEKGPGFALLNVFSHMVETVISRLNRVPYKNFVAFLDMLGIKLLPTQPALVPLTFKLSKGTDKEILIPARTQAAAGEVPFETEKNLLATPAELEKVISVDPFNDAIFEPSSDLLFGDFDEKEPLPYAIVSSPSKGDKGFQLDHVTDLEEGNLIKIGSVESIKHVHIQEDSKGYIKKDSAGSKNMEYAIIAGVTGNIIKITNKLLHSYPVGTPVEKIEKFNLFEGKNIQEHSFYLGHKDLLNIESAGVISLEITLAPNSGSRASSLNLEWEYWGEDLANETDDWIALQIEEDETERFRKNGMVILSKSEEGKIKEEKLGDIFKKASGVEINNEIVQEAKSRWIRCRLKDKIAFNSSGDLPKIDTISVKASLEEENQIPPDAGFFNDVPMDLAAFLPEAKVLEILTLKPHIGIVLSSTLSEKEEWLKLDSVKNLKKGHRVYILRAEVIETEGIVEDIQADSKKVKVKIPATFNFQVDDIIIISDVNPFGKQPRLFDTFYISSQESFSKKKAKIILTFSLTLLDTAGDQTPKPNPKISWEYWNGKGWKILTIIKDDTDRLLTAGKGLAIEFYCPEDIEEIEVNGQKNYWIRARIVGGDYGRDEYSLDGPANNQKVKVEPKFKLPIIRDLKINYFFEKYEPLHNVLTYNNLDFHDKTDETKSKGHHFQPFIPLEDTHFNFYLGFDQLLRNGPIRIFFAARELSFSEEKKPKLQWTYSGKSDWKVLDYSDATEGLIRSEILEVFIGASDFSGVARFGSYQYWIRGSLTEGEYEEGNLPVLEGIYPNTTWAFQAETITDEILGSSDGEPAQTFSFLKFPVLEGQEVRVRETISEEERQILKKEIGDNAIFEKKDEAGNVTQTWVLWSEKTDFFESKKESRHYTLDRAFGRIRFGDGIQGKIPAGGDDNIMAFTYQAGGGTNGNVKSGDINTLKSAVAGVDKVTNPVVADGGADTATLDQMLEIGPAMISHRNRAVTADDFEWLAKEASRKVVRAKCLPDTNNRLERETGWVTLIIVPDSIEEKPIPSLALKKIVYRYLEKRCANTLIALGHLNVEQPSYLDVSVSAVVFAASIDVASEVERMVFQKLKGFFHPLTGGPEERGWDFGRNVFASDIYALLEAIDGVDHVENLRFVNNGTESENIVKVSGNLLVANGVHRINLKLSDGA